MQAQDLYLGCGSLEILFGQCPVNFSKAEDGQREGLQLFTQLCELFKFLECDEYVFELWFVVDFFDPIKQLVYVVDVSGCNQGQGEIFS